MADGAGKNKTGRKKKKRIEPPIKATTWCGGMVERPELRTPGIPDMPVLALWLACDEKMTLLSADLSMLLPADEYLAETLYDALDDVGTRCVKPKKLLVSTEAELKLLEDDGVDEEFELAVDPAVGALVRAGAEAFLSGKKAEDTCSLEAVVPLPGRPGIDEEFARCYLAAVWSFAAAKPWKRIAEHQVCKATLPDGMTCLVMVIGSSGRQLGLLTVPDTNMLRLMRNAADSHDAFGRIECLKLYFALPDNCHSGTRQYLNRHHGSWESQSLWPQALRVGKGFVQGEPTAGEYRMLRDCAAAITAAAGLGEWPPKPGSPVTVSIDTTGQPAVATLQSLEGYYA